MQASRAVKLRVAKQGVAAELQHAEACKDNEGWPAELSRYLHRRLWIEHIVQLLSVNMKLGLSVRCQYAAPNINFTAMV